MRSGTARALADVYDALVTRRPYKEPLSAEAAAEIIVKGSGSHFDPQFVQLFAGISDRFAAIAHESVFTQSC